MSRLVFPQCWDDDERMDYLSSALPKQLTQENSSQWKTKYLFWSELIVDLCCQCKEPSLDFEQVKKLISRNDRIPLGLNQICQRMVDQKQLITRSEFINANSDQSWLSWGVNMAVAKPLGWMAGKVISSLQLTDPYTKLKTERLVCPKAVELKCKKLLELLNAEVKSGRYASQVIMLSEFQEKVRHLVGENSIDLILSYLQKTKRIVVTDLVEASSFSASADLYIGEKKAVKFVSAGENTVSTFSDSEKSSVRLLSTHKHVQHEIDELSENKTKLDEEVKAHLRSKDKNAALEALKRSKKVGKTIEAKRKALNNMEHMLDQIADCKTNAMIMDTYKTANTALRDLMNTSGLNVDVTEKIMDEVNDTLQDHNDISQTLAVPLIVDKELNDDELEAEFASLVLDDKLSKDVADLNLPELPDFNPTLHETSTAVADEVKDFSYKAPLNL